ncbi:DUF5958 family protein [Kitasatospora sp. NPDC057198]|uniref:DUF5958 family protein n=1 Tax=Kitasatospora sp. NPDC057198 TaxID=3346046 RepID=UPI003639196A
MRQPEEDNVLLMINRVAQGLRSTEQGLEWFAGLEGEQRQVALYALWFCCDQARAEDADVPEAVRRSGLRPTHTPAVMLARGVRNAGRIAFLPADEQVKSYRLLSALFAIADERRRGRWCADGCSHHWHNLPEQQGL